MKLFHEMRKVLEIASSVEGVVRRLIYLLYLVVDLLVVDLESQELLNLLFFFLINDNELRQLIILTRQGVICSLA
jgi:hypothetical protein